MHRGRKSRPYLRNDTEHSWIKHRTRGGGRKGRKRTSIDVHQVADLVLGVLHHMLFTCPNNPMIKNLCLAKTISNKVKKKKNDKIGKICITHITVKRPISIIYKEL